MAFTVLQSACFVEDGQLHYLISLTPDGTPITGNELIVHNGTAYSSTGGTGIPALLDTNYITVYKK